VLMVRAEAALAADNKNLFRIEHQAVQLLLACAMVLMAEMHLLVLLGLAEVAARVRLPMRAMVAMAASPVVEVLVAAPPVLLAPQVRAAQVALAL